MTTRFRSLFLIACGAVLLAPVAQAAKKPRHVTVEKQGNAWLLKVDGKPYFVRGVGCNQAKGEHGEDYLRMAREMGANTVRTWGGAPREYLDHAAENKLMVNLGIWLNPIRETGGRESYQREVYTEILRDKILNYVREMKDHPALLTWNIGNEAIAFTEDPAEKEALAKFLERIIKDVHEEDPFYPVVYSASAAKDLPLLQKFVPSLDIIGTNIYGSLSPILGWMREHGMDKPVVVTEFGPLGSWDTPKDRNNLPFDPSDHMKSTNYAAAWRQIEDESAKCIGGFAFVLGEPRNQDSLTWYNLNYKDLRRDTFWTMYSAYTKKRPANRSPKINEFRVQQVKDLVPGQRIEVYAEATDKDRDRLRYEFFITHIASDPLIVEPPKFFPVEVETVGPGRARLRVPNDPGLYRVYALVTDTKKNAAIANRTLHVRNP